MNKKIRSLLAAFAALCCIAGIRAAEPEVIGEYTVQFRWNKWTVTDETQIQALEPLLALLDSHPEATVEIVGWADPTGTVAANRIVTQRRADNVAGYLIRKGFPAGQISARGAGIDTAEPDYGKARRAVATVRILVEPAPQPEPAPEPTPAMETPAPTPAETTAEAATDIAPEPAPVAEVPQTEAEPWNPGKFALRTNALYWLGLMPNLGVEWRPSERVGIVVNGGYAMWKKDSWEHNWAGWFVAPEVRIYLGEKMNWFVGPQLLAGSFNLKPGDKGYQGDVLAGGVMGGYRMKLSRCWDVDFTLGVGYVHLEYESYRREGNMNAYINDNLEKNTVLPIQAGVNFIWKIN